jgi:hypothetical protein
MFGTILKVYRWNKDPAQLILVQLLSAAGRSDPKIAAERAVQIETFISNKGWNRTEAAERIAHALSLMKRWSSKSDQEMYQKATAIGLDIRNRLFYNR